MRIIGFSSVAVAALCLVTNQCSARLPPITWWRLVEVIDERTLRVCSDKGETNTITLACIGRVKEDRGAKAHIKRRLHDHKFTLWPLETKETNWYKRPMCIFLDMDLPGRGGDAVDFAMLNEELLAWGYVPFAEVKTIKDPYGLKERLLRAKTDAIMRRKQKDAR